MSSPNEYHFALKQVEKLPFFSYDSHHKDEKMSDCNRQQILRVLARVTCLQIKGIILLMYDKGTFGKL